MVATTTKSNGGTPSMGKWLLMFFIAGDNDLSALFVDQLKALKDAGFAKHVEVVVRFDPNQPDVKTRTFNVNRERKKRPDAPSIQVGDGQDPFVHNMSDDFVRADKEEPAPAALNRFIVDSLKDHRGARHHMLFLLGHGLIVGNDTFLPDDSPKSGIKLKELGRILRKHFGSRGSLELLGLHSCAMSGIEVLYELQGTAKYMVASEGLSFVNGWPYRQLMKRFLNGLRRNEFVEKIVEKLYWLTFFNAKDFLLAGFPLELSLISLDPRKVDRLTGKMKSLVRLLKRALAADDGRSAIQLAHLESQSYFGELYTDLYDFCLCLQRKCQGNPQLTALGTACSEVIDELEPVRGTRRHEVLKRFRALIIHSNYFGWRFQYSRGLSIFFPWIEPRRNAKKGEQAFELYKDYQFTRALGSESWLTFLNAYIEKTKRVAREQEDSDRNQANRFTEINRISGFEIPTNIREAINALEPPDKPTGASDKPTGGSDASCDCPEIKNFPKDDGGLPVV